MEKSETDKDFNFNMYDFASSGLRGWADLGILYIFSINESM